MQDSYLTLLDYEKVLLSVGDILPKVKGGAPVRSDFYGGI